MAFLNKNYLFLGACTVPENKTTQLVNPLADNAPHLPSARGKMHAF